MEWLIICIVVVGISCFFIGFCIRRSNNNRQNVRDEVLINDSNNRQNGSDVLEENRNNMVRENTGDHEVILVNADINKDLSISQTNLIINNNIGIGRALQNKYGSLKIVENINFDVIDNRHYCNEGMNFFRRPGIFRKRLEEREKIEKQQISRRYRKVKSKTNDMSAPKPIDEDIKEDDEK